MDVGARLEVALGGAGYRLMTRGATRLLGFAQSETEIGGVRVPFLARGWGVPTVLVHGFGADKESWLPFAGALRAKGRCVLIPDLPGFGAAGEVPPERASAAWQARVVAGLLDRLGYARAHLVGNSMGGGISLRFAHDYPARAISMTLIGSVGPIVHKSEMALALDRGENPLLMDSGTIDDLDRLMAFVLEKRPRFPRAMNRYMAETRFARRDAHAMLFRGWIDPRDGEEVPRDLESLRTPALVIHGALDRVIDPSTGKALADRLPNARPLELLEGIGHVPQMEAPRRVARLVDGFIDGVEAARVAESSLQEAAAS
jgi:pimeloyl-ACP methyl ester carboxylesterase